VLTLALGIGPNAAIFSAVCTLLLRSLPFQSADRIVGICETHPQIPGGTEATFLDYLDWRAQQKSFEQVAVYSTILPETMSLVVGGRPEQVHKVFASGNSNRKPGAHRFTGISLESALAMSRISVVSIDRHARMLRKQRHVPMSHPLD
jgi:hypothetical protein